MAENHDLVWEHGDKVGIGFKCQYCRIEKGGGGATRLKEHLAHRGKNVRYCPNVPKEVKEFFGLELDRNKQKRKARERQRLREVAAARSEYVDLEGEEEDPALQAALQQSREEAEFRERAGTRYERGGGSGSSQVQDSLPRMLARSRTQVPERVRDYNLGSSSGPRQPRIDTGPWTDKGRNAKSKIGRAWSKFCHAAGIPGRKVDDPYFKAAIIETQKHGEFLCIYLVAYYKSCVYSVLTCWCDIAGTGVKPPTGREIDGVYLEHNEKEIMKEINKWKEQWPIYGVTIMCDPWNGPMHMSVVNFLLYCNGTMYFWKSFDVTGHSQDANFIVKVCQSCARSIFVFHYLEHANGFLHKCSSSKKSSKMSAPRMLSK